MSKKKQIAIGILIVFVCVFNILVLKYQPDINNQDIQLNITIQTGNLNEIQYYYVYGEQEAFFYTEDQQKKVVIDHVGEKQVIPCMLPASCTSLRLDFGTESSLVSITDISVKAGGKSISIPMSVWENMVFEQDVDVSIVSDGIQIDSKQGDPYIAWDLTEWNLRGIVRESLKLWIVLAKVLVCLIIDLMAVLAIKNADMLLSIPSSVLHNYKVVWRLSVNDFKTKYAGSYFGIFWAFVNPLVTTMVYWFVFQVGLRSGRTCDFPFVLWLMSGLIPWFFFQDALMGGTNALLEYNYLVKKVVFDIDILPIVKVISALFVHVFFTVFILALCACYGYFPTVYTLQLVYLIICNFVLVLGLSYLASAIVGFFRDLTQIINIILQVGVWVTPIMWDASAHLGPKLQLIMKLNPMYYIVDGFRSALLAKEWVMGNEVWTIYFWVITLCIWMLGIIVFKKLKVHFADVL